MNALAVSAHPSTAAFASPAMVPASSGAPTVVAGGGSVGSTGRTALRIVLIVGGLGAGLLAGGAIGAVVGLVGGALIGAAMLGHAASTARL